MPPVPPEAIPVPVPEERVDEVPVPVEGAPELLPDDVVGEERLGAGVLGAGRLGAGVLGAGLAVPELPPRLATYVGWMALGAGGGAATCLVRAM